MSTDGIGTIPYMSPELIRRHYSKKVSTYNQQLVYLKEELEKFQQKRAENPNGKCYCNFDQCNTSSNKNNYSCDESNYR
eukprot:Pgem_evm1s17190